MIYIYTCKVVFYCMLISISKFTTASSKSNFDPETVSKEDESAYPLHDAILKNDQTKLQKLLNENTKNPVIKIKLDKPMIDKKNRVGQTPLHIAVTTNNSDIIKLLLQLNPDANIQDSAGMSPLHVAAQGKEFLEILKILLPLTQDSLNAQNELGQTPLHLAVMHHNFEAVKLLLQQSNIDPNAKDKKNKTALNYAQKYPNLPSTPIMNLFLKNFPQQKIKNLLQSTTKEELKKEAPNSQNQQQSLLSRLTAFSVAAKTTNLLTSIQHKIQNTFNSVKSWLTLWIWRTAPPSESTMGTPPNNPEKEEKYEE